MGFLNCKDLDVLRADGCQLVDPPELFKGLMLASSGDPCGTGCSYNRNNECPAYKKHHTTPQEEARARAADYKRSHTDQSGLVGGEWRGMSIKQIAAKEGISLNEARRRKQEGRYT